MPRFLVDWLADGQTTMERKRPASRLHLLTVLEARTARNGNHSDGGSLILRVRDSAASWVFRHTAASAKRREMGVGTFHRANAAQAGASLTGARDMAADARQLLQ